MTQKRPTQKSANAKLAKKKLVIERRRRDNVTTSMTSKFPENRFQKNLQRKFKENCNELIKRILNRMSLTLLLLLSLSSLSSFSS